MRRAAPAVVNVYNRSLSPNQEGLAIRTLGSGVIMSDKGYILTNKHVINNAEQIIVALQNGRISEALLVGSDNLTDLAVLKIDAVNLPVIPININRTPHIGDVVLAIGNPYNLGQTVTQGIISATGRIGLSSSGRQNFLQTDASINQGNSGEHWSILLASWWGSTHFHLIKVAMGKLQKASVLPFRPRLPPK